MDAERFKRTVMTLKAVRRQLLAARELRLLLEAMRPG